jgi:hypothetical protein
MFEIGDGGCAVTIEYIKLSLNPFFGKHFFHDPLNQLLPVFMRFATPTAAQRRRDTLFDIFSNHVNLYVHFGPDLFPAQRDLLLSVLNEHDTKCPLRIVYFCQRKRSSVNGDIALRYQIW